MLTSRFYDSRMLIFQGFEWSFMTLAYITVACRIYVRLVMRKARLFSADYWLILGLLSCQGLLICDTITYSMDAMDDFTIDNVAIRKVSIKCNYIRDISSLFSVPAIIYTDPILLLRSDSQQIISSTQAYTFRNSASSHSISTSCRFHSQKCALRSIV